MDVFDAARRYGEEATPVVILAGKEYGSGSSRDWAAKGPWMQVGSTTNSFGYAQILRMARISRLLSVLWVICFCPTAIRSVGLCDGPDRVVCLSSVV